MKSKKNKKRMILISNPLKITKIISRRSMKRRKKYSEIWK
jgi:hypothetical protein